MALDGLQSQTLQIAGHNGDMIDAYFARPVGNGPFPGVVVIHHAPGWDEWSREVVHKFALHGYMAIAPHLYHRWGPGDPDDLAAKARAEGGSSDDAVMGDVEGGMKFLRAQPGANGKIGVIGFCSGGRHTFLAAARLEGVDAAVDCWGGNVAVDDPATALTEKRPIEPLTLASNIKAPLLGIFGNDDTGPSPANVNRIDAELKRLGKTYDFHRYDGAGHGFFAVDRPGYRPEQAVDAWAKVFDFYGKHLAAVPAGAGSR